MAEAEAQNRPARVAAVAATGVLGAALLWAGLQATPGSATFYLATLATALVWVLGSILGAGRATFGRVRPRHGWADAAMGFGVGVGLLTIFWLGAGLVARIDWLAGPVERLLLNAQWGSLPLVTAITVLNGVTEETYFRGSLDAAVGGSATRRIIVTSLAYTLVTAASGVLLLALAGLLLGLATGWLRQHTGALVAPVVAHLTWSVGMLYTLAPALAFWS